MCSEVPDYRFTEQQIVIHCTGFQIHELGTECQHGCHTLCNKAGTQINVKCEEKFRTIRKPGRDAKCRTIEEDKGCRPDAKDRSKNNCHNLKILSAAPSPTKFIYRNRNLLIPTLSAKPRYAHSVAGRQ